MYKFKYKHKENLIDFYADKVFYLKKMKKTKFDLHNYSFLIFSFLIKSNLCANDSRQIRQTSRITRLIVVPT